MFAQPGRLGMGIGRLGLGAGALTLVSQALAILAKYGSAANLYLPGVGVINGITAGNWLDSAGTTAATVDNQVGLVVSAGKAVGAELYTSGANGFTSLTGISGANATVALSGGGVLITCAGPNNAAARGEFSISGLTTGNVYLIEIKWRSLQNTSGGSQGVFSWTAFDTPSNQLTPGTTTCRVRASSSTGLIRMYSGLNASNQAGDSIVVDSISIRELPGAHLTQSTATNRPVLRRGLVNQLRRSADFANTDQWLATNLSFASTVGPSGANDATIITATNAASAALISSVTPPIATSEVVTLAYVVKATGGNYSRTLLLRNNTTATNFQAGSFYCLNGQVTGSGWQSTAIGNGWFVVTFTQSTGIAIGNTLLAYGGFAGGSPQGGVGSTFVVHRIGLFAGAVTAQQIIDAGGIPLTTTAPASSANGNYWWQFDGIDDRFTSTLTTGNDGWVCFGARLNANAVGSHIYGNGASSNTDAGVWIRIPNTSNMLTILVGDGTTREILSKTIGSSFVGIDRVFDAGWNASLMMCALNGDELSQSKTVNCATSKVCIFGGSPSIGWFSSGNFYPVIIMSVLPTADERVVLRRFIASLSGVIL